MGVLDGILVVEMSEVFQAPLAAQALGDLGADVVKVERVGSGEILRRMDPVATQRGRMSSYFAAANRNKRSICLDLKNAGGKRDFGALLERADVFIHNYRPGALERLGFGYDAVHERNPRLVYASATGFGESGPLAGQGGQDMVIQSITGMATASAGGDGVPRLANTPAVDFASGMILAQGILAALLARERTGRGQRVGISLYDTAIAMQSLEAAALLNSGFETRWFQRSLNFMFETRSGWITVLGFFRENPLSLICRAAGLPDMSKEPGFETAQQQLDRREEIAARLAPAIAAMTREQALSRFEEVDVLCAPVLTLDEALRHPQAIHNSIVVSVPVEGEDDVQLVANPLRLSEMPCEVRLGPPALDAHRDEIRRRWIEPANDNRG